MKIPNETTCNNSKCIGRMKCLRYKGFLKDGLKTHPIRFSGNAKQVCINYLNYEKK